MKHALSEHIKRYISLDQAEQEMVSSYTTQETFKKKSFLLKEEQVCRSLYFVEKGCLRLFFINDKGVEQTCQFAIENWWMSDFLSFDLQIPSQFCIQAVEHTQVYALSKIHQEELLGKLPELERYFRLITQRMYGAAQLRIKYLFSQSGEERYHQFNHSYPEFVQRIPQYMLASFLGFTPEFLSKIRAGKN